MHSFQEKYIPNYSADDYMQWEGNWELIGGIPYAMAPAPGWYHQELNLNIASTLRSALKGCTSCKVNIPVNYKIDAHNIVQPDVVVVCQPFEQGVFLEKTPGIIFEILSPSTAEIDRNLKFSLYQSAGVKYYAIVHPLQKKADVYILIADESEKYKNEGEFSDSTYRYDIEDYKIDFDFKEIW